MLLIYTLIIFEFKEPDVQTLVVQNFIVGLLRV